MKNQNLNLSPSETITPSQKSLEDCLMRTALLFSRSLAAPEIEVWKQFLESYSQKAIEYAFENWQRNGRFFPKPKEILELVNAFKLSNTIEFEPCKECQEGWIRIYEGKTAGGHDINPKFGAMTRCQCWLDWRGQAA